MMTSAQVVETSVNVTSNSPSQDYTHLDDHASLTCGMTPGFKTIYSAYDYRSKERKLVLIFFQSTYRFTMIIVG